MPVPSLLLCLCPHCCYACALTVLWLTAGEDDSTYMGQAAFPESCFHQPDACSVQELNARELG